VVKVSLLRVLFDLTALTATEARTKVPKSVSTAEEDKRIEKEWFKVQVLRKIDKKSLSMFGQ
jgi:hypothetical protein